MRQPACIARPRRIAWPSACPGKVRPSDVRRPGLLVAKLDWQVLEGKRWRVMSGAARSTRLTRGSCSSTPDCPDEDPTNFSVILARAPRSDRAGGARGPVGRKVLAPGEPTEAHSITLPASVWREIERIGEGNRSEGVRRLVDARIGEADEIQDDPARLFEDRTGDWH